MRDRHCDQPDSCFVSCVHRALVTQDGAIYPPVGRLGPKNSKDLLLSGNRVVNLFDVFGVTGKRAAIRAVGNA